MGNANPDYRNIEGNWRKAEPFIQGNIIPYFLSPACFGRAVEEKRRELLLYELRKETEPFGRGAYRKG